MIAGAFASLLLSAAAYYFIVRGGMTLIALRYPRTSIGFGGGATLLMAFWTIDAFVTCSRAPVFIPPEPGGSGEGRMVFPCDAPFGAIDRVFIYCVGPALIVMLSVLTYKRFVELKRL